MEYCLLISRLSILFQFNTFKKKEKKIIYSKSSGSMSSKYVPKNNILYYIISHTLGSLVEIWKQFLYISN